MSTQFLYFLTVPGNEDLLKEEIKIFCPQFSFAYSRPGFCTFKNTGTIVENLNLQKYPITYALTYGETLTRIKIDEVPKKYQEFKEQKNCQCNFFQLEYIQTSSPWIPAQVQKVTQITQIDFIRTTQDEVFIGTRVLDRWQSPLLRKFCKEKEVAPISRAYYKIADACAMFAIKKACKVLELGSAPGGISQFLLEHGCEVTAVDPAQMNSQLISNTKFNFHCLPIQDYSPSRNDQFELLISDMNLSPSIVLSHCARMVTAQPSIKELLCNLKTSETHMVSHLPQFREKLEHMRFKTIHFVQLPGHRREFLAYAKK